MTDARPSHCSSRRGGHGGTGGTPMAVRPAASPDCPPRSGKRGTTGTAEVGTTGLSPVVPLRCVPRGTAETQQRRGVPPVPPRPPAAQQEGGDEQPPGVSHLSHPVPRYRSRMSCDGPGMCGGRRVDVHAPFAGGVGVRPAATRAVFGSGEQVHASCSRDRDAPHPRRACDGRTGCRKRAFRRNVLGLRASAHCGRVRTQRRQRTQAATARAVLANGQNTGWY
jgi:hypothetical protein